MTLIKYWAPQTFKHDLSKIYVTPTPYEAVYLASDVEPVLKQCYHTIDQLQENLGTGSLLKADAKTLLTLLRGIK